MLEKRFGIVAPMAMDYLNKEISYDINVAMDAQPTLVSTSNAGIPAFLANFIDPEFVRVLVTPNKAAQIAGEVKKGDWTTLTAMFPLVESTGETSSYGDYSNNGSANSNENWVNRQSYQFQTITRWGERELEMAGLGRIDKAANLNIASALTLDKFMNKSYFFGISGLANYGLLNDPSLIAPITPATKAAGGTTWATATAVEIYEDVRALFEWLTAAPWTATRSQVSFVTSWLEDHLKAAQGDVVTAASAVWAQYRQANPQAGDEGA